MEFLCGLYSLLLLPCFFAPVNRHRQLTVILGQDNGHDLQCRIAMTTDSSKTDGLEAAIQKSLKNVNKHLSNWDPNSEISRFNNSKDTKPIKISSNADQSDAGCERSSPKKPEGFFDVTLGKLINLWGFGPGKKDKKNTGTF